MDRKIRGVTLIELLIALSILAILLGIGIPQFNVWKKKYDIQEDTKALYSSLQQARMKSFVEKRVCGVYWGDTSSFSKAYLRCDTDNDGEIDDNGGFEELSQLDLKSNFQCSHGYLKFNRGIAVNFNNIHPVDTSVETSNNCVSVSATRVKIGTWDGNDCE